MKLVSPKRFIIFIGIVLATICTIVLLLTSNKPVKHDIPEPEHIVGVPRMVEIIDVELPSPKVTTPPAITTPASITTGPAIAKPVEQKTNRSDVHKINDDDLYLLAKLIHGEAGVDSMSGKLAVGTVVMNRVHNPNTKLFGGPTIKGVIYHRLPGRKSHQFSCIDSKKLWSEEPDEDDYKAARKVLEGYRSFRSTFVYYYNPDISSGIRGVVCDYQVGMHVFGEADA